MQFINQFLKSHVFHGRELVSILCLFILCTVFATSAHSQNFKGGVHGGLVGSQVAGDLHSGYNKAGISAGGWVSLAFTPRSVFQMELSYVQKGSRENPKEKNGFNSYLMQLGYVEMPFLYRMIYSEKLNFEAGPSMNFLIHHREEYNQDPLTSGFAKNNLCLIIGLSYNLSDRLKFDFRTDNSILSIRTERVNGDVWRFFDYGQFSDALIFSLYYQL
ncbi:MAG: porin family protein [Omnitrophica WOR_2 bacterium]